MRFKSQKRMDFLIYSGLNILTSPMYGVEKSNEDKDHVKGTIQFEGIPIYGTASIILEFFKSKKIKIIPKILTNGEYDDYIFHLLWQTFWNSLLYNGFNEIIYDDLLVIISLVITKGFQNKN